MLIKTFTAAALATSLALVPTTKATADTKDAILGAIIGGAVVYGLNQYQKRQQAQPRVQSVTPLLSSRNASPYVTARAQGPKVHNKSYTPPRATVPSIPATQEGRAIQTALDYFGFQPGPIDGRIGRQTRSAIAGYQAFMGYPATGTLSAFEQHVLTQTYLRAEAGGTRTFQEIARLPEGARGLLKVYREELAGAPAPRPSQQPVAAVTSLADI